MLVIFDTHSPLAQILTEAYRQAVPDGLFLDFENITPDEIRAQINQLSPGDLVILVQSSNFRLNEFRFRIELFARNLKTIEHAHLNRISGEQVDCYINALTYNPTYYRPLGHALKKRIDEATRTVVRCDGTELIYDGPLETAKLNIGDYAGMKNVGGLFPIGEVFTESKDFKTVNGTAKIFAFASEDHLVRMYEPFTVTITNSILTAQNAPPEFDAIIKKISEEEEILVRELGFGLNPAMGKDHFIADINSFERQKGLHLSLGAKHAIYAKQGYSRRGGRYHVDVFVDVERVTINDTPIFQDGNYTVL